MPIACFAFLDFFCFAGCRSSTLDWIDERTAAQRLRQAPEEILEDLDTEAMRLPKGPLNLNSMELGRIDGPVDCCEDSFLRFEP